MVTRAIHILQNNLIEIFRIQNTSIFKTWSRRQRYIFQGKLGWVFGISVKKAAFMQPGNLAVLKADGEQRTVTAPPMQTISHIEQIFNIFKMAVHKFDISLWKRKGTEPLISIVDKNAECIVTCLASSHTAFLLLLPA